MNQSELAAWIRQMCSEHPKFKNLFHTQLVFLEKFKFDNNTLEIMERDIKQVWAKELEEKEAKTLNKNAG